MIAATACALAFTEVHESLPPALAASSQMFLVALAASVAVAASLAIALRSAAADIGGRSRARTLAAAPRFFGPSTRGIRVDGRVGKVDFLENMLSLGQQEAILATTLEAAAA